MNLTELSFWASAYEHRVPLVDGGQTAKNTFEQRCSGSRDDGVTFVRYMSNALLPVMPGDAADHELADQAEREGIGVLKRIEPPRATHQAEDKNANGTRS